MLLINLNTNQSNNQSNNQSMLTLSSAAVNGCLVLGMYGFRISFRRPTIFTDSFRVILVPTKLQDIACRQAITV
jgi:hypothetical protein